MSDEQQVDDTYSEEDAAIEAVKGPALALMISASIGLLWQAVLIFAHLNMMIVEGADPAPNIFIVIYKAGQMAIGIFVIIAAKKMWRLENWGWGMGASIASMVPCIGPCCFLGFPVGIWALAVLDRRDVKGAFTVSEA